VSVQTARLSGKLQDPAFWGDNAALCALVVICAIFASINGTFSTWGNISDVLVSASILVVLSMAQQFVIVTGGIDLSIASNLSWTAVVFGLVYVAGYGMMPAMIAGILSGLAVGLVNGLVVTKLKVNDFIATLGMLGVMTGISLLVSGDQSFAVDSDFLRSLAIGEIGPIRYFYLIALIAACGAWLLFTFTRFGVHVLATGGDRDAARAMGINIDRMRIAAYCINGALVGVAGILLVAYTGSSDPAQQTSQLLNSIASVVLGGSSLFGGRVAIVGTLAGALVLTVLNNGFTLLQISNDYQPIAAGIVVIAAAVLSRLQR